MKAIVCTKCPKCGMPMECVYDDGFSADYRCVPCGGIPFHIDYGFAPLGPFHSQTGEIIATTDDVLEE